MNHLVASATVAINASSIPDCIKVRIDLPAALSDLDRGRLTFPRPSLIPFLRAVEERMLEVLNETNYKRYGKQLFEVGYPCFSSNGIP